MLEGHKEVLLEQYFCFNFQSSNNHTEYKSLIARMKLAREVGATHLRYTNDSQLVTNQVKGDYPTKEPLLDQYL